MRNCPVCGTSLAAGVLPWHWQCPATDCEYEGSTLEPSINDAGLHAHIDERQRETALKQLRIDNFRELLTRMVALQPSGGRLLEVGSAHGWFLDAAQTHFDVLGIEPDVAVVQSIVRRKLPVRQGFFPDALESHERFDAIVFNDVFEHLPDAHQVLQTCHARLNAAGMLVLNLPSSRGVFYRLAKVLARMGARGPFERMWQLGAPSPHLHYFNLDNLRMLLVQHGYAVESQGVLAAIQKTGLYERVSYADANAHVRNRIVHLLVRAMLPFVGLFPSDIVYVIARKQS